MGTELDFKTFTTTTISSQIKRPEFRFIQQFDIYTVGVSILELINGCVPNRLKREVEDDRRKFYQPEVLEILSTMLEPLPEQRSNLADLFWTADNLCGNTKRW